ncbi:DUF1440 domain-containing protein [Arthrobacter sp. H14]|uniref:DUF1440 domain-containing protein n=1 Tax=Arthrobacter sp. H14 TaxID=1312959 RepID=UPI000685616A|nr:DUF1440 domain-containing protein [Arthrobacter sp. H14]
MRNQHATGTGSATAPRARTLTDMLIGAAAGAIGVWAMDQIGWVMLRHENQETLARDLQARPTGHTTGADTAGTSPAAQTRSVQDGTGAHDGVPGTGTVGILTKATQVSGVSSPNQHPAPAAVIFHFSLGMLPGALYGPARRRQPWLRTGNGALYGLALFLVMDETAAPVSGIASAPGRYPWQAHARGLVAHVVLGVVTETLLRTTERFRWLHTGKDSKRLRWRKLIPAKIAHGAPAVIRGGAC